MRRSKRLIAALACAPVVLSLGACTGVLSTLNTAGTDAAQIATLFWWMTGTGVVVWLAVMAVALFSRFGRRLERPERFAPLMIIGGGVVLPGVLLIVLLVFGLAPLAKESSEASPGRLSIAVAGEQWWWRVRYTAPSGDYIDLANEIRLPLGERIDVSLSSDNVIHAFWIPAIAGKVDMIPGRTTRLSLEPTRTGIFRGTCAEYCGTSHALMAFPVEVLTRADFDAWLARQAEVALAPVGAEATRGRNLFLANGCGACHTVRGSTASGTIGPDLTHVGSRMSLAAAALPNQPGAMVEWIAAPQRTKPGAHMPAFGMLATADLRAMAAYLGGLQ